MRRLVLPALVLGMAALATQATLSATNRTENQAGWFLLHEGPVAKLAYGLPDSDHLALMFTCAPGESFISVYGDVEPEAPSLRAISTGPTPMDPLTNGDARTMVLALDDQALTDLARRGRLGVRTEQGTSRISADADEQGLIRDFLGYCALRHV